MSKNSKYGYRKAEAALDDVGARHPDEIYEYRSEKSFRSHMKEHGLNPDKYIKPDSKKSSGSSNNDSCFLTTACVMAKGLADDCDELQTLRSFRDTYLISLPNGQEEIDRYYQIAPTIVSVINSKENSKGIWNDVYAELIAPCVRMIKAQEYEATYQLYRSYSLQLHEKYCG
jgi:hypothetical protein